MSQPYYTPPVAHAVRAETFLIPLSRTSQAIVRMAYYGKRLLVDFMIQLEVDHQGRWVPAARVDCCKGVIHRHQFTRSTGADLIDHKPWASIPVRGDRREVDRLLQEGYDWAYGMLIEQSEELIRRWRHE